MSAKITPTKIEKVEALHLRLGRIEEKADGTQEVLLVRVTTDTGLVGHGEAVSNATVARSIVEAPRSAPFRHGLGVGLIGADPLDPMGPGAASGQDGGAARLHRHHQRQPRQRRQFH